MAWSGTVAGAPPFQHPSYGNPPPTYGQQPAHRYGKPLSQAGYAQSSSGASWPAAGHPRRAPDNRPQRKKGNPVITRYPPPPGYRGPAQPQGPLVANQFSGRHQAPRPGNPHGIHAFSSYHPQGHNATPVTHGYQGQGYGAQLSQAYTPAQTHQWPPHPGFLPRQGYPQPPNALSAQAQPPQNVLQQVYGQPGQWPSQNRQSRLPSQDHRVSPRHVSTPSQDTNTTPTPATAQMATSRAASISNQSSSTTNQNNTGEKPPIFLGSDDWDFEFDGAIWPKSNEAVDPALSLGVIIWHPAKQVTRALPSTFAEAEAQALEPAPEGLGNGESVSMYFTTENSHEAFLDVRQTDDWSSIQDDPVFFVFTDEQMQGNVMSIEDCVAQRDRPDESSENKDQNEDHEMHDASWDIMRNLNQALMSKDGDSKSQGIRQQDVAESTATQEEILARLGVTGDPKPPSHQLPTSHPVNSSTVSHTKICKSQPQPVPPRANSYSGSQNLAYGLTHQRPYGSMSSFSTPRPPPVPEQPKYDPWNAPQHDHGCLGRPGSPTLSEGSNQTMAGSDFAESEKPCDPKDDASSVAPTLQRGDSSYNRKRSYEDADKDEEQLRQHDDHSKRKRRSQVDSAYSRR